jgi:hypothetical protein
VQLAYFYEIRDNREIQMHRKTWEHVQMILKAIDVDIMTCLKFLLIPQKFSNNMLILLEISIHFLDITSM